MMEFILSHDKSLNVDFTESGGIRKRRGYKTMRGLIKNLKCINRRYKRLGFVGDIKIRLPINE